MSETSPKGKMDMGRTGAGIAGATGNLRSNSNSWHVNRYCTI